MRSSTSKQKALMISASTLVMLSATSVLANAKDGQKDSGKESEKESKKQRGSTTSTTRVANGASTSSMVKREDDDDDNDDDDDDDDRVTTTTKLGSTTTTSSTTSTTTTTLPGSSSTTAPSTTTPSTTTPSTTTPSTTAPSTTVAPTTTVALAPIRASQAFLASKIGAPIRMDTTVVNDSPRRRTLSVVITMSSTGTLPSYLEARALTGPWLCSPTVKTPVSPQVYTCVGTLAARTSGVITVSSGSNIVGTPGQTVSARAVVTPSGAIATATATL
jgi:hypothetical protein